MNTVPQTDTAIAEGAAQALDLASQGVAVFPLAPGAKAPATSNGFYAATTDPAEVSKLFANIPNAGIGIMPARCSVPDGTLIVLDGDSDAAFQLLRDLIGEPTVTTGGRGAHWYVVLPGGLPDGLTKTSAKHLHLDIDIIGAGGGEYVCAPPTHVTGRDQPYTWSGPIHTLAEGSKGMTWLRELAAASKAKRTERKPREDRTDTPMLDEWMRDTSWPQLLTEDGWTDTGKSDSCGCLIWQHPWGTDTERSATAHDEGCPKSDSEFPGGALHCWSTTAQNHVGGASVSKFMYVANVRYGGDFAEARQGESIPDEAGFGSGCSFDHLEYTRPTPNNNGATHNGERNPFVELAGHPSLAAAIPGSPPVPTPVPAQAPPPPSPPSPSTSAKALADALRQVEMMKVEPDGGYVFDDDGKVLGPDGVSRTVMEHERVMKMMAIDAVFWPSTPELTTIWNAAVSAGVNPWSVLGDVLVRVASVMPPNVVLPSKNGTPVTDRVAGGSLNLINLILGGPYSGKGESARVANSLYPTYAEMKPSSTAEGIFKVFMASYTTKNDGIPEKGEAWYTDTAIVTIPEVGRLDAEMDRRGSHTETALNEMYMGERTGSNTGEADRRTHLPPGMYRMGLLVHGQPGRCKNLLECSGSGLPQRINWFPAKYDYDMQPIGTPAPLGPLTKHVVPGVNPHFQNGQQGGVTEYPPSRDATVRCIEWAPAARTEMVSINAKSKKRSIETGYLEEALQVEEMTQEALAGHENFSRLKVAAIFTALFGHQTMLDEDWYLSGFVRLVSALTREMTVQVVNVVGNSKAQRQAHQSGENRVIADDAAADLKERRVQAAMDTIMAKIGDREMSAAEISRYLFRSNDICRKAAYRDPALKILVEGGHLVKNGNRYKKVSR